MHLTCVLRRNLTIAHSNMTKKYRLVIVDENNTKRQITGYKKANEHQHCKLFQLKGDWTVYVILVRLKNSNWPLQWGNHKKIIVTRHKVTISIDSRIVFSGGHPAKYRPPSIVSAVCVRVTVLLFQWFDIVAHISKFIVNVVHQLSLPSLQIAVICCLHRPFYVGLRDLQERPSVNCLQLLLNSS